MIGGIIFLAVCFLAYANGANDNFRGVASLTAMNSGQGFAANLSTAALAGLAYWLGC